MNFDAAVVFVTNSSLLVRLAVALDISIRCSHVVRDCKTQLIL
jgi:hypothetical protein